MFPLIQSECYEIQRCVPGASYVDHLSPKVMQTLLSSSHRLHKHVQQPSAILSTPSFPSTAFQMMWSPPTAASGWPWLSEKQASMTPPMPGGSLQLSPLLSPLVLTSNHHCSSDNDLHISSGIVLTFSLIPTSSMRISLIPRPKRGPGNEAI